MLSYTLHEFLKRVSKHLLSKLQAVNPKLLMFVEGTCGNNFPVQTVPNLQGYWWGGETAQL